MSRYLDYASKTVIDAEEIEGFMFGGYDSRFWLLKKFINEMPLRNGHLPPQMLCWNMISIKVSTSDRLYDLIVEDEKEMDQILLYLLSKVNDYHKKVNAQAKVIEPIKLLKCYKMLRIRMKISYEAFRKRITVHELLFTQIVKTYEAFNIDKSYEFPTDMDRIIGELPLAEAMNSIIKSNIISNAMME